MMLVDKESPMTPSSCAESLIDAHSVLSCRI